MIRVCKNIYVNRIVRVPFKYVSFTQFYFVTEVTLCICNMYIKLKDIMKYIRKTHIIM